MTLTKLIVLWILVCVAFVAGSVWCGFFRCRGEDERNE